MWLWAAFIIFILILLALDLGVFHRKAHVMTLKEALASSGAWISIALAFNVFVYLSYEHHWFRLDIPGHEPDGQTAAVLFLTGYVVEKSLGLDNILMIAIIFEYFRIPALHQHRVLFWGVVGALVMRAVMILAGVALIQRFSWILYLFGVLLIVSGLKMALARDAPDPAKNPIIALAKRLLPVTHDLAGERLAVRVDGKLVLTPLALALIMIETSDLIFAAELDPGDLCHYFGSVSGVHQQHHGCAGSALAVLCFGGHRRSFLPPEARARAASGAYRHQIPVEGSASDGGRRCFLHARSGHLHFVGSRRSLTDLRTAYAGLFPVEHSGPSEARNEATSIGGAIGTRIVAISSSSAGVPSPRFVRTLGTPLVPFEILHGAFVLFGLGARLEGAQVVAPSGFWIDLPRVEAIAARLQFTDHGRRLPGLLSC